MKKTVRLLKLLVSVTLILSVLIGCSSLLCYGEGAIEVEIENYVTSCLGGYLGGIGISPGDTIYMTQGFKIENTPQEEQQRTFFVFKDNTIIGQMDFSYVEGNCVSSFAVGDFRHLTSFLCEGEYVALTQHRSGRSLSSNKASVIINGQKVGKKVAILGSLLQN